MGCFTHHLLDALYGRGDGDGDGQVTVKEVSAYLDRHMTRAAMRMFDRRQRATVLGPVGVVLARAVGGTFPERPAVRVEGTAPERSAPAAPAARAGRHDVQRDLMLLGMKEANQAGNHEKVLDYAAKLRDLGGALPVEARYWQVEAYLHARRYKEAAELLTSYLEETGRDGEHYETALKQLLRINERLAADDEAYDRARQGGTAAAYGEYLRTHPDGRHAEARRLKAEAETREDDAAYRRAQAAGTAAAYGEYLRKYPRGRHAAYARQRQAEAQAREDDAAFASAQASDTAAAYAEYLRRYPNGRHAAEARRLREQRDPKRPGTRFRDCERCPELVVVPAGSFMMGSRSSEEGRSASEGPVRRVTIGKPFAVGAYEVTFADWDACVADGGCGGYRPYDEGWGRGSRPVINVSWDDSQGYVSWLSRETGAEYRLLSEAEWEYVARAGTTPPFHTGRTISTDQANYDGNYR